MEAGRGSGLIPGAPGPGKAKGQHRVEQSSEKGSTGFHPNPGQPTKISCPHFLHLYNSPFLLHKDGLQIGSSTVPGHIQALIREVWTLTYICMYIRMYACMCACMYTLSESEVTQSCLTLCDPMDGNLPGSEVHGIFQARILEWAAISFSGGSFQRRDRTRVSCIADRHFTV